MTIRVKRSKYQILPPGQYPALLDRIEEDEGDWGPFLKLYYTIELPKSGEGQISELCSCTFSERSKLFARYKALTGLDVVPEDLDFESDAVIGKHCILVIMVRADANGVKWNRIDAAFPAEQDITEQPPLVEPGEEEIPF